MSFFSGRSRAHDILDNINLTTPIVIDFAGVQSTSQSFISELLYIVQNKSIAIKDIQFINVTDPELQSRINKEIERLAQLMAS